MRKIARGLVNLLDNLRSFVFFHTTHLGNREMVGINYLKRKDN